MQPTGWNQQPGPGAPPAWHESPGRATSGPAPGWGDHAPGFGNPPPTWGAAAAPGRTALDDADEPRGIGGTVAAHVVLWGGLVAVAGIGDRIVRPLIEAGAPSTLSFGVSAVVAALPVAVALVLAGRGATLRLLGAAAGVVVVALSVFFVVAPPGAFEVQWVSRIAAYVFTLGTWMVVRRHARSAHLLLVALALLLLLWFPGWGPAPAIVDAAYAQGIRSPFLVSMWFHVPVLVAAVVGLLGSLLRPRPTRSGDVVGVAVVGGLFAVLVLAVVLGYVVQVVG